jgi:hypothetical protein
MPGMSNERHHPAPSIASWCSATSETDCIVWAVTTPKGPWSSATLSETAPLGQWFDCATRSSTPELNPLHQQVLLSTPTPRQVRPEVTAKIC